MLFWIGLATVIGGGWALGRYLNARPRRFRFEGRRYVRRPDGRFTDDSGVVIVSPEVERVQAHWDETNSSSSDSSWGDGGGGDGGGGGD